MPKQRHDACYTKQLTKEQRTRHATDVTILQESSAALPLKFGFGDFWDNARKQVTKRQR
jgi:hypothetical protein